ncbi:MAG: hypothetical protein JXA69_10960 [Phycisphaerae bacterium]|nr:hypothetical protein [Phycisphaerae bacterium]
MCANCNAVTWVGLVLLFAPVGLTRVAAEETVTIHVDTSRASAPISRRLFGKFTEHLYSNIYDGAWAQIVRNTSFEDWRYFFSDDETMEQSRSRWAQWGRPWPVGLAAYWRPEGTGDVTYSLDADCVNTDASQHIQIKSLASPTVGVQQERVYLPLHRESDYAVSLYARARGIGAVRLCVRHDEQVIGSVYFDGLSEGWMKHTARLRITETVPPATSLTLVLDVTEPGELWLDQFFIFPADHILGFDREVVEACREARLSMLRFPGGNFVSGYHWRDGVGPVDERPMRRNVAWHCPEYNHVGTDEHMAFCETVGCEPLLCINAGTGTPEEAAAWVEYCNGSIETPLGRLRAANGHPRPYNIRYWEVGNELYGDWQAGHCTPQEYAERYHRFAAAMRKVDPGILFIANGFDAGWHAPLLEKYPKEVRSFSLHPLVGGDIPKDADPANVYLSLMAFPTWHAGFMTDLADQMKAAGVEPRLALTEMQIYTQSRNLPTNATMAEALFLARYIHTAIRLGDLVELITHSALVNHGSGLRKRSGVVYANPSWHTTQLYSTIVGTIPLDVQTRGPVYSVTQQGMPKMENVPHLDAVALTTPDRSVITLLVVNTHPHEAIEATVALTDFPLPTELTGRQIRAGSFMTQNDRDEPDNVTLTNLHEPAKKADGALRYAFPPHSVTELIFPK